MRQVAQVIIETMSRNRSSLLGALSAGDNVNERGHYGETALHWAAALGYADMAQVLIAHGADRSAVDLNGAMPVDLARRYGNYEVVTLCRGASADKGRA